MPDLGVRIVSGSRRVTSGSLPRGQLVEAEVTFPEDFTAEPGPVEVALDAEVLDPAGAGVLHCAVPTRGDALTRGRSLVVGGLHLPDDVATVRFSVRVQDESGETPFEGWAGQTGQFTIGEAAPTVLGGRVALDFPCIYDVLQRYPRGGDYTDDLDGVLRFVADGVRQDLGWVFDTPEYHVDDEIGEDGEPLGALSAWQRHVIVHLSGLYYSRGSRRVVPWASYGQGYPLTSVCNNLTDLISTMRGRPPSWSSGYGTETRCLDETARHTSGSSVLPPLPPPRRHREGAAEGDDPDEPAPSTAHLDVFDGDQVRPGTIFLKDGVHISTVLRVRGAPGSRRFQSFDTGGLGGTWSALPAAYGAVGGLLKEELWRSNVSRAARQVFLPAVAGAPLASVPFASPPLGARFRLPSNWSDLIGRGPRHVGAAPESETRAALLDGVERPIARLAVFEHDAGREASPVFFSRPFVMTVPPVQLFSSIVNLPQAGRYEARWLIQAGYRISGGAHPDVDASRAAGEAAADAHQPERSDPLVLELWNDREGVGHCWRPAYDLERLDGFFERGSRLLTDADPAPYQSCDRDYGPLDAHDSVLAEVLTPWTPGSLVVTP